MGQGTGLYDGEGTVPHVGLDCGVGELPADQPTMVLVGLMKTERHAQLLLVEDLEPGLGVVPQLAVLHRDVVLAQPVGEEVGREISPC